MNHQIIINLITDNKIILNNRVFDVKKIGKNIIIVTGARGAQYFIVNCYKMSIIGFDDLPVFSLTNHNGTQFYFTVKNNQFELLDRLG